jgi:hypothetical protein
VAQGCSKSIQFFWQTLLPRLVSTAEDRESPQYIDGHLQPLYEVRLEGFEPPTRGLGIRGGVLHRIAENCESRISKPFFFSGLPNIAGYCVPGGVREWCQLGAVNLLKGQL